VTGGKVHLARAAVLPDTEGGSRLVALVYSPADHEIVTLYYGNGVQRAEAESLAQAIRERYSSQEIEVIEGGQPHYYYILSTE